MSKKTATDETEASPRVRVRAKLFGAAIPNRVLSTRAFAEKYVMLPRTSPYGNVPFRCSRLPYSGILFDEMDSGNWKTFLVSGPSQSGKTLSTFVIPTIRDVKELQLNTIVGFPEADMASDKWDTDFRPTFEESPELMWLMPKTGPGSKGGRIRDRVTLGNGVDIKIMTAGGQDTGKAGYTSPRVRVTEAAGWSHAGDSSVEANPLRQLRARMKAFKRNDPRRCLFVEGTLTVEDELPWSAKGEDSEHPISSQSLIVSPCPHCGKWISPDRCDLTGWKEAESEDEAANESVWLCPKCKHTIDDQQRRDSVSSCRLIHSGQSINDHGEVVGANPPTSTLWFHWKGWDNLLRDAADFGVAEWEANQIEEATQERENAERELCQFDFSTIYKPSLADGEPLKPKEVRKRTARWKRNVLPHDTVATSVGIDLGDWTGWPFVVSHREGGAKHVPSYGAFDVKRSKSDEVESRIVASLHEYADNVIEEGFPQEGTDGLYIPDKVWIDGGYLPDAVAKFIRERGGIRQDRYYLVRGRGKSARGGGYKHRNRISGKTIKIGKQWWMEINYHRKIYEITFNSDYWKMEVDARLRADVGKKGAIAWFAPEVPNEHAKLSHHLCNEQFKKEKVPGKGIVERWVVTGDQHLKDAAAMALAAGDHAGIDLMGVPDSVAPSSASDVAGASEPSSFYASLLAEGGT